MADIQRIEKSAAFQKELQSDESILWRGSAGRFSIGMCGGILRTWIISAAIFLIVSVLFYWAEMAVEMEFLLSWQLVLTVLFLYFFLKPLFNIRTLKRSAYFVTDRRVILIVGGRTLRGLNRAGLHVEFTPAKGGMDVLFGSAVGTPERKRFRYAWDPKRDEYEEEVTGIIFFRLEDTAASELRKIFK